MTIETLIALLAMGLFTVGSWFAVGVALHRLERRVDRLWRERRKP